MAGCQHEQVEPNERIMSNVMKPGEGAETQKQESLEKWTVAKVPQWLKAGLMEHIVELVVVDNQVRQAWFIYVTWLMFDLCDFDT
jgi:hypothetical protein